MQTLRNRHTEKFTTVVRELGALSLFGGSVNHWFPSHKSLSFLVLQSHFLLLAIGLTGVHLGLKLKCEFSVWS